MEQVKKSVHLSLLVFPSGKVLATEGGKPLHWIDACLSEGAEVHNVIVKNVPIPPEKPTLECDLDDD